VETYHIADERDESGGWVASTRGVGDVTRWAARSTKPSPHGLACFVSLGPEASFAIAEERRDVSRRVEHGHNSKRLRLRSVDDQVLPAGPEHDRSVGEIRTRMTHVGWSTRRAHASRIASVARFAASRLSSAIYSHRSSRSSSAARASS